MSTTQPQRALTVAMPAVPAHLSPEDGLRNYLREIAQFPMLTHTEEMELANRWRKDGDVSAAHRLVTSHLRLVAKLAGRYRGYGLPASELIAEGNIGLMQAVKRFEPERGFRLATYAMWWIKASIQEYILRSWSLVKVGSSAAQKRLFFNLRKVKKKLGAAHNLELSDSHVAEIAAQLDVSKEDVVEMDRRMNAADVFLNSPMTSEDDSGEKMDFLADDAVPHDEVIAQRQESSQMHAKLMHAMQSLNERERVILQKRKLQDEPSTLEELSEQFGISRERVRQIEAKAFEKLQKSMLKAAA